MMYLQLETLQANGSLTVQPNPDGTIRFLTRDGSFVDLGPREVDTLCAILPEWRAQAEIDHKRQWG